MSWLQQLRERRERGDRGFTLIELLLVIVILGVLAAVVVLSVRGISDRGEESACAATQTAVITANEAYYAQHGSSPAQTQDLLTGFLTPGDGASVVGNTVSGAGWSFVFDPATGTVTSADGCDIAGGVPGDGEPGPGDPGGGDPTEDCVVSAVTGNTVQLQTGGTLPAFAIDATAANCDGVTLEVFIQGGITAALGATVPAGTTGYTAGNYDGVIRIQGGANLFDFTFTITEAPPPPPCSVSNITGTTQERNSNNNLPSFTINATRTNCDGIALEVFIDRPGNSDLRAPLGVAFTSNLNNWNTGNYSGVIRNAATNQVVVGGNFTFTVNPAPVCRAVSVNPLRSELNWRDDLEITSITVQVTSQCQGESLRIHINRGQQGRTASLGSSGTTRTAQLDQNFRDNWNEGNYTLRVQRRTGGNNWSTIENGTFTFVVDD